MKPTVMLAIAFAGVSAFAQKPASEPDVLLFTDGEKLIGHLVSSNGASVTFKSDMAGEITVDWSKVKELHSSQQFAVIGKNVELKRHPDGSKIPQGTLTMTEQKIEVRP